VPFFWPSAARQDFLPQHLTILARLNLTTAREKVQSLVSNQYNFICQSGTFHKSRQLDHFDAISQSVCATQSHLKISNFVDYIPVNISTPLLLHRGGKVKAVLETPSGDSWRESQSALIN
jgi:hypothetical protein